MIRLAIRFGSGRFHATPWAHHVNEGVPEWPPSPWRLLRAAISVLYTRSIGIPFDTAMAGLLSLTEPPTFTLPAAAAGHTRHYLSMNGLERNDTALTLDAFVAIGPGDVVWVHWPEALDEEQRRAVCETFRRIPYLGRAESACSIEVVEAGQSAPDPNCVIGDGSAGRDVEIVRVLGVAPGVTRTDLERSTAEIQAEGWGDPPGSRWLFYRRPVGSLSRLSGKTAIHRRTFSPPCVARLALGGTVLPLLTDCLSVAKKVRRAALKLHGDAFSRNFQGREDGGLPFSDPERQHRHAHFVPFAGDSSRPHRITHVLIYCPEGLTEAERDALLRLDYLAQDDNRPALDVVCDGFGSLADFETVELISPGRRVWKSTTPLLLPRHPKANREGWEEQVRRELSHRKLPDPVSITFDPRVQGRYRPVEFELRGSMREPWPSTPAVSAQLSFDEVIRGPILLGRHSHHGLGQFAAVS